MTKHAKSRIQQRSIPKIVSDWLAEFGEEVFDKKGCLIRFFNKNSRRTMEKTLGRHFVQQNKKYLSVYEVVSSSGDLITTGWRTKRIKHF
jgi:hypothetical protein